MGARNVRPKRGTLPAEVGMLTAVCVQTGNYLGRGEEYVRRLKACVDAFLTLPHRFVCLTDAPTAGIACLPSRFPGWWEKLRIFEPGRRRIDCVVEH